MENAIQKADDDLKDPELGKIYKSQRSLQANLRLMQ